MPPGGGGHRGNTRARRRARAARDRSRSRGCGGRVRRRRVAEISTPVTRPTPAAAAASRASETPSTESWSVSESNSTPACAAVATTSLAGSAPSEWSEWLCRSKVGAAVKPSSLVHARAAGCCRYGSAGVVAGERHRLGVDDRDEVAERDVRVEQVQAPGRVRTRVRDLRAVQRGDLKDARAAGRRTAPAVGARLFAPDGLRRRLRQTEQLDAGGQGGAGIERLAREDRVKGGATAGERRRVRAQDLVALGGRASEQAVRRRDLVVGRERDDTSELRGSSGTPGCA